MMELRFIERETIEGSKDKGTVVKVLQTRNAISVKDGIIKEWSMWNDVPLERLECCQDSEE